ncbi:MAG TPA: EI24 domain-containing protein [Nitratifractor sp.]|nr:EI24 domain-containing protein [Nitratifractor sp.]
MRKLHINRYALFSLTIIALSGITWGIVWYFKGGVIHDELNRLLTLLPFETVEKANAFLILFFMLYNGMVVFALFTTSFFSKGIVQSIEFRCFKDVEVVRDNLFNSIGHTVKDTVIFALLSIVLFPLLFIPLVNIAVQFILWLFLTKDTLAYDGAALSYKDVSQAPIKEHKAAIWSIASVAVAFNFIPIVNFFGPLFGELAMFHYFKKLSQK